METIICKKCQKIIEAYNSSQAEHLMQQHMLKHKREEKNDKKKRTVYCYVCADPMNIGHLLHLKNSWEMGDKLYIGVLTNLAVCEKKVPPVFSFEERFKTMELFKIITGWNIEVVAQDTYSPIPNILKLKPDILAESTSHKPKDIKEAEKVMKEIGGMIKVLPYYDGQSSSKIKEAIRSNKQWTKKA